MNASQGHTTALNHSPTSVVATIRTSSGVRALTAPQAFALAHSLVSEQKCKPASKLLDLIEQAGETKPRTSILRAYCLATERDFAGCDAILRGAFTDDQKATADRFQGAFVFRSLGLYEDAERELACVAEDRKDLASAWLLLGDFFADEGNSKKATQCWREAVRRDSPDGSVACAAQMELDKIRKESTPSR